MTRPDPANPDRPASGQASGPPTAVSRWGKKTTGRRVVGRLLWALPALWLILTMVFLLIHVVPGDPVVQMLGEGARAEDIQQLRHSLGLDLPLGVQYGRYLEGVAHGDLGASLRFREPVLRIVLERYPATIELALVALLVCIGLAVPAGVIAAARQGRPADHVIGVVSLLGLSVPNFALGPLLILLFSIEIGWLPVSGRGGWSHLVLPAATLGAALAAILTRMVRTAMLEELSADYIRTARAKGLSERRVLLRHALPNALFPVVTIIGLQFGTLLAGTIVTETIFSWPGIGRLAVSAIEARDYPLLQGCILVIAFSYVVVNLLTDVVYALIDPRVRFS
jgi:ABC-type dipeptide/oligopeptide/nickel transport system permease component